MGPKRFHAPPIALDELPPLRAVILSHDHLRWWRARAGMDATGS
ncbi:MAG: hypothetical protein QM586_14870 [Xenophilus sp.]